MKKIVAFLIMFVIGLSSATIKISNMRKSVLPLMAKKFFIRQLQIVPLLLISLGGCTKDPIDQKEDNIRQQFTVVETNSNMPIPGVTVKAYRFGNYLGTALTNDSGNVVFNTTHGVAWLGFSKDQYWPGQGVVFATSGPLAITRFELLPFATLKVRLSGINQIPPGSLLNLKPQVGSCNACNELTQLVLPRDHIAYLKGGGGVLNSIDWQIDSGQVDANHKAPWSFTQSIMVNHFDTAEFVIEY